MAHKLGRYQLLRKLATGGMAEVYVAKQRGVEGFEKLVVVKRLLAHLASNQRFVSMFLDEARLAARLSHPNVVHIYDLGFSDGNYFIAMEYIHGEDMGAVRKACRKQAQRIPLEHVLKMISQACEGLHYAHTKTDIKGDPLRIVHCDISPQNILVSYEGVVKVVDFGVAKAASLVREEGQVRGKLAYMSPEQAQGREIDARSDIFSMGIVLWELVTGQRLYGRFPPEDILRVIVKAEVPSPRRVLAGLPVELEAIILKAMQKDPGRRFQSAYELHLALEECMRSQALRSDSMQIGSFMRALFSHKMEGLNRLLDAEKTGIGLESQLFDQMEPSLESGPSTGSDSLSGDLDGKRVMTGEVLPVSGAKAGGRRTGFVALALLVLVLGGLGYVFRAELLALLRAPGKDAASPAPPPPVTTPTDTKTAPADAGMQPDAGTRPATRPGVRRRTRRALPDSPAAGEPETAGRRRRARSGPPRLTIRAVPPSEVFLDHVKLGVTPLVDHPVSPGTHKLQLYCPGLQKTRTLQITARAGQMISKKIVFPGRLLARGDRWTEVYVGKKKLGTVPVDKSLPPGEYTVTFTNPTLGVSQDRRVVIEPGKTSKLSVKFAE